MIWFVFFALCGIVYFTLRWALHGLKLNSNDKKYVLITGCDTGFGNIIAKRLHNLGFHVFACCLTEKAVNELKECCTTRLKPVLLDVSKSEDIQRCLEHVRSVLPPDTGLWALINNAGIVGAIVYPDVLKKENYEKVFAVNLYGIIEMCTTFLPLLRLAHGRIINTSSVVGLLTTPSFLPYCISKRAVEAYSDGLRRALVYQNVSVHVVEPGPFRTNIVNSEVLIKCACEDFESCPKETQQYYGKEGLEIIVQKIKSYDQHRDTRLSIVTDAYEHAVTARFPKYRYLIGTGALYYYWSLSKMPEWLSDYILGQGSFKPKVQSGKQYG